ncbi:M9 family metallopeptidase [Vibrio cyclitrophicus]|uniref:M9 family metallopeptidase n=1 Tax=Vibrio cyclitrophicus TaxID=47951 RepID=UPI00030C5ADA|nr:M9 family metallopeptidase [Vibrio cyclitrophicus]OEF30268.1 collagenase [Vibrio cyclitrophicus 1F97]OEF77722.1 collagenase [Vibrio cyclitrophicus 1F111]
MKRRLLTTSVIMALSFKAYAVGAPIQQRDNQLFPSPQEFHHGVEQALPDNAPTKFIPQNVNQPISLLADDAVSTCTADVFAVSDSTTLINTIKKEGSVCVNKLFSADSSIQVTAFSSHHMYNVAKHASSMARNYNGGGDAELQALFLFIRTGYYAEFDNDNVSFESWVTSATKEAVDEFVNNAFFFQNNDGHGKVLAEVITTMDSAELQHVYLDTITEWLTRWNADYAESWDMRNAVNKVFTILYRGLWNEQYVELIGTKTALIEVLANFALNESALGRKDEFMAINAGRELGRMTKYKGTVIEPLVTQKLKTLFSKYQMFGYGDGVWLGAAETTAYNTDCEPYGICDLKSKLKDLVLSQQHTCSSTIRIVSQEMTAKQYQSACEKMGYEETYFHKKLETGNQPVKDDHNTQLQVNVFNSSDDYKKYAGLIFGISTDNGGMYLEGDPSKQGNIPNFIAYEASYANADHFVWNLEHEYIHYLDGRFDMYGDFNAPTERTVWWSEGVAEYIAQEDDNNQAVDTIKDGSTYTLAQIFETTYDGFDVDRIYRWGYLAVRFMFEEHKGEINKMLLETRKGHWSGYKSLLNQWSLSYENQFVQWQQKLVNGGGGDTAAFPEDCSVEAKVDGGNVTAGVPVCLADQQTVWLGIGKVDQHQSIAITTANGTGNLLLEYSNQGWPNGSNVDGRSNKAGNNECIYLTNQSDYWGYIKVSGEFENAALVVDFNTEGCRN